MPPVDYTQRELTLIELWKTNGRQGVQQYLVHEGVDSELIADTIDSMTFLVPEEENIALKPVDPTAGLTDEYVSLNAQDTAFQGLKASEENPSPDYFRSPGETPATDKVVTTQDVVPSNTAEIETHTVTLAGGSTHEVQTANGVVVSYIPTPDAVNPETAPELIAEDSLPDEIKTQDNPDTETVI
jgi:hypothetical protein